MTTIKCYKQMNSISLDQQRQLYALSKYAQAMPFFLLVAYFHSVSNKNKTKRVDFGLSI